MIELSVVRDLVTIFGVLAAFTYYVMTVQNANKVRKTQLFMSLYEMFETEESLRKNMKLRFEWDWSDYDDFMSKYGREANPEAMATLLAFQNSLAKVGLLLSEGMIDVDNVYSMMRNTVVSNWERYEPVNIGIREQMNYPSWMENYEYLYREIKKIDAKRFPELNK
jgi:hypothetical protein